MKPEDKVCTIEQAKELKELGVVLETERVWVQHKKLVFGGQPDQDIWLDEWHLSYRVHFDELSDHVLSAPDTAELMAFLPVAIKNDDSLLGRLQIHKNYDDYVVRYESIYKFIFSEFPAQALGEMAIYLIENGFIKGGA